MTASTITPPATHVAGLKVRYPRQSVFFDEAPRKVLIVKPSAIGDIVHALPVLNLLRIHWPEARISWLATPACAGLVEGHPQIDEVIRFDRKGYSSAWRSPRRARELIGLSSEIRGRRFDLVIDLQGLFRSGWLVAQTWARRRIGFANAREFGWLFYTHRIESSWSDHAVDRYLCIASALGLGTGPVEFQFAVTEADRAKVAELVPAKKKIVVFLPGANWETKRWPAERYAALIEPLRKQFGLETVIAGAANDRPLAAKIPGALDLTGRTDLRELTALLERAQLVIAGDTGPMHIASALGRPLVTMYGPTDPVLTGPYGRMDTVVRVGSDCSPCFSRKSSKCQCLRELPIASVMAKAEEQLSSAGY